VEGFGGSAMPELTRRRFLAASAGVAGTSLLASRRALAQALGVGEDALVLVPADKRIPRSWTDTLYARGRPTAYTGGDLRLIGMPVGGGCCGQVYVGGDGRLWHWDIFNASRPRDVVGLAYTRPPEPSSPFRHGVALRVGDGAERQVRTLDGAGFEHVSFSGQYPIATIRYADRACPVEATLQAFSPFVPLEVDDSTLPVTILSYTLRNVGRAAVDAELLGWSENPVCLHSRRSHPVTLGASAFAARGVRGVEFAARTPPEAGELPDDGTFVVAALETAAVVSPSVAAWSSPGELFGAAPGPQEVDAGGAGQAGSVAVGVRLPPGRSRTVRLALCWHFPVPDRARLSFLRDSDRLLRHYAARFDSARDVAAHVAGRRRELEGRTRLWVRTFYRDSTLPHWFLERTLATASTFATSVCHRFADGRFHGWEGTYCCDGTCQHVWNYAQALGRLFGEVERDTRERVDLGIGFHPDTGQMGNRAEADMNWAADGQCGTILRIYREHLTSPDASWLRGVWPRVRKALEFVMGQDAGRDGTLEGRQPTTLDTDWYGEISWVTSMYVAALHAGAEMARIAEDGAFAARCRRMARRGSRFLETALWTGEYFVQRTDPAHPEALNHNRGCHVDQMLGQALASQLGLPRVLGRDKSRRALRRLYRYNFTPDAGDYRQRNVANPGARVFAENGEHGMIMTTFPHGGTTEARGQPPVWAAIYFNECWSGQEYQVAGHMIGEGLVREGLLVTRAVHERYRPAKRNPYNEVECDEHYARAMASYGVFLEMCGFEYDGPRGHIGFAPRLRPEDFAAAFTAAEGWGLYRQRRSAGAQRSRLELRHGSLRVTSLSVAVDGPCSSARVELRGRRLPLRAMAVRGGRVEVELRRPVRVRAGEALELVVR
jgi:uncharacterized protein (DUF608 family)